MNDLDEKKDVLDPVVHRYLLQRLSIISDTSGIPEWALRSSMTKHCCHEEQAWVREFKRHVKEGSGGLCLHGGNLGGVDTRMKAIGAALIRNFTDARMYGLDEIIALSEENELPEPTVMLLPTFYLCGYTLPAWRIRVLHEMLLLRVMRGKQTVIYVEDFQAMEKSYGQSLMKYLTEHWIKVTLG